MTMNSHLRIALSVCVAATALTAGTIVYAYMQGETDEWFLDDNGLSTFSSREALRVSWRPRLQVLPFALTSER